MFNIGVKRKSSRHQDRDRPNVLTKASLALAARMAAHVRWRQAALEINWRHIPMPAAPVLGFASCAANAVLVRASAASYLPSSRARARARRRLRRGAPCSASRGVEIMAAAKPCPIIRAPSRRYRGLRFMA